MNNYDKDIFNAFDEESQTSLEGLKVLDFDTHQKNMLKNPFEETRTAKGFQEISAFKNSPFGQYWNINIHEWAKPSFGSAKILDKKNIVIADKSSKISHTQADFYNTLIGNELSKYNFVVYSDPDGEKVLKMYNDPEKTPNANNPYEVLVFIETDDGMFDFGKIVRVKFGTAVIDDLKNKYFQELPWKDNDPKDIANEFIIKAWSTSVSTQKKTAIDKELNSEDFKDLLIKAIQYEYDNQKFDDFSWFVVLLEGTDYIGLNIPNWCFSLGKWFRERKYIEDKYWNGDLPEKEYTPAFMSDHIFYEKKEDREKAIKELFEKPFNYLRDNVYENLGKNDPISKRLRQDLYIKIDKLQDTASNFIKDVLSEVNIPEGYGQIYIKHHHAFILGLYNGILEFLAGICDLLAIAVLLCREELGFRMSDMITEKFENFVNDLFYNTLETLKKIGAKAIEVYKDFMNWYHQFLEYDGKSYKILKELGELVPDILTFAIPVLKGSKAVKLAQAGEEMVEVAEKQVAKEAAEELSEAEAKHIARSAREALEKGTAAQASTEAAEKLEQEIIEKAPVQLEEVVIEAKNKNRLSLYEKSGLLKTISKTYNGLQYQILIYSDRIVWKVSNKIFNWDNHARLWGGELEFDFNTFGVKGLGQKWTDDAFEIYGERVKTIKVEWKQLPDYPNGESLGYSQFYKVFNDTYDFEKAVRSTTFYETMEKKGFKQIYNGYEDNNKVIVILTNKI